MGEGVVATLTEAEIQENLAQLQGASTQTLLSVDSNSHYRYVKPFSTTYAGIVTALADSDERFRLGLTPIDLMTRGFGPKELIFISGFSTAGKTQLCNTTILHNKNKRILFFSLDDPAEMILLKLACMSAGYSADILERRIKEGDQEAKDVLKTAANETFKNLIVIDDSIGLSQMDKAIAEATEFWGGLPPECVIIDYLELIPADDAEGGHEAVKKLSKALKRWVKDKTFPTIVIHQGTRTNSKPGAVFSLLSMAHGGEQEATMVIGVRRKRDDTEMDLWEREKHGNTVTIALVKNKRPPAKVSPHGGVDFFMDPDTGLIRQLREGDLRGGLPPKTLSTTREALDEANERYERAVNDV